MQHADPTLILTPRALRRSLSFLLLVAAYSALSASTARAETFAPVHLRIGGREVVLKTPALTNGKETYVPVETLVAVGKKGKLNPKGDVVVLVGRALPEKIEIAVARPQGKPMIALADLAKAVNGVVAVPDALDKDGKPVAGKPGDTVYLLARVLEAGVQDGALRVTTSFPVPYRVRNLGSDPNASARGYIDCLGATVESGIHLKPLPPEEKRALRLRIGQNAVEVGRIVLELAGNTTLKSADAADNAATQITVGIGTGTTTTAGVTRAEKRTGKTRIARGDVQPPSKMDTHPAREPIAPPHDTDPTPSADTTQHTVPATALATKGTAAGPKVSQPPVGAVKAPPARGTTASRGGKLRREEIPIEVQALKLDLDSPERVRLEVLTKGKPRPFIRYENGTSQLVVEIPNAALKLPEEGNANQTLHHPLLSAIRAEQVADVPPMTRLTLEMPRIVGFSAGADANRMTLELRLPKNSSGVLADKLIVIDPGHGGSSTGAVGRAGGTLYEKNVTLAISLKLRAALEACGAKVVMTRDRDVDVALYDRPRLANSVAADLFISIHNDSTSRSVGTASGTSTYYHIADASSRALAACIQAEVIKVTGLPSRGVLSDGIMYASGFAVLRASTMPAILCEVAYINNPRDRQKLGDPEFQQRVAVAICRGIRSYVEGAPQIERTPPPLENGGETETPMPANEEEAGK